MGSELLATGSILAAFFAGTVALFAPCCIVFLAPSYLAAAVKNNRWRLLPLTFVFAAGLALVLVPITLGVSLLAGAIGGLLYVVALSVLLSGAAGLGLEDRIRTAFDQNPQMPLEARDMLLNLFTGGWFPVLVAAFTVPMYAVFSMVGALLGLALFKKKTPTAPPV